MKLRYHARTDVGRARGRNEDFYGIGQGEIVDRLGTLLVLCDGAGGHASGEVASRMAVEAILTTYYDDQDADRASALKRAFAFANAYIYAQGRNMLTTAVAALFYHATLHVANVGDSRAYLIRATAVRQITRDHSFVSEQVAAGLITPDEARVSPYRGMITRSIGYQEEVAIDLFQVPLAIGDDVVLCCDGLHGLVTDAEIGQIVVNDSVEAAVDRLIDMANQRGGDDNITVVVARVEALDGAAGQSRHDPSARICRQAR